MQCNICLNIIQTINKKTLICNHSFCTECINKWLLKSNFCPCCRAKVQNKKCDMCKYGCIECRPKLETVMNDIDESMLNMNYNALNDSLNFLELVRNM